MSVYRSAVSEPLKAVTSVLFALSFKALFTSLTSSYILSADQVLFVTPLPTKSSMMDVNVLFARSLAGIPLAGFV